MDNKINWDEVVQDLGPRLFRYFCVRFSNEQADDLTQETLIRLVRKVNDGKFKPERGTLKMLSFGIAHYVALESRHTSNHDTIDNYQERLSDGLDIEQVLITKDLALKMRNKMKDLSDVEQQTLSLFVDEELTLNEVSVILQVPEGTIKSHIHRAKKKLIQLAQNEGVI